VTHSLPGMSDIAIETSRLVMRPLVSGDAEAYARAASDTRIGAVMDHIPTPCPTSLVEEWSADVPGQIAAGTDYRLVITQRSDGSLIGAAILGGMIDLGPSGRQYELSYWVNPVEWNKGLATECATGMRDWAFGTLKAGGLRAACALDNTASARVLEKTGFHFMNATLSEHPDAPRLRNNYRMDKPRWEQLARAAA